MQKTFRYCDICGKQFAPDEYIVEYATINLNNVSRIVNLKAEICIDCVPEYLKKIQEYANFRAEQIAAEKESEE